MTLPTQAPNLVLPSLSSLRVHSICDGSCGDQELNIPAAAKGLHLDRRLLPRIQHEMRSSARAAEVSCCARAGYLGQVLWHRGQHWKVFQFWLVPAKDIL